MLGRCPTATTRRRRSSPTSRGSCLGSTRHRRLRRRRRRHRLPPQGAHNGAIHGRFLNQIRIPRTRIALARKR